MNADLRYPESKATEVWTADDGVSYALVQTESGHWCGYCRFPARPLTEPHYKGIVTYVPVHGGITWARQDDDGSMVYGFDCAHLDDEIDERLRDRAWLRGECERMAIAIRLAAEYEDEYLILRGQRDRDAVVRLLDLYHDALERRGVPRQPITNTFGVMINLLSGRL